MEKDDADQKVRKVVEGLLALRAAAGISQYRLAELSCLSHETVRLIESHKRSPTLRSLFLLTHALNAKLAAIVGKAEDEKK